MKKIIKTHKFKIKFLTIFLFISINASANDGVLLQWKINSNDVLLFETTMERVGQASGLSIDLDKLDIIKNNSDESKKIINELKKIELPKTSLMTTTLKNIDNDITVEMKVDKLQLDGKLDNETSQKMEEVYKNMEGTVQLRGKIDHYGKITSFYYQQRQKNLLSLFLELPDKKVKPGDTWSLSVNFIEMGHTFIADKANRINRVELVSLKPTSNGDLLAELDYTLMESVEGVFYMPTTNKGTPTTMKFSYVGRGEFLVNKGRWKKLVGQLEMESTGAMTAQSKQILAMTPGKGQ